MSKMISMSFLLVLSLIIGCSVVYNLKVTVTIDDSIEVLENSSIVIVVGDETCDGDKDKNSDGILNSGGIPAASLAMQENIREYSWQEKDYLVNPSCIWIWAFIDLNDNGELDNGEPFGVDPINPRKVEDDVQTSFVINRVL